MSERPFKDWEALSAYLDGALPPRERARLEARLAQDAALRRELAELRALKAALRDLPPPRLPRNFTLRPETATPARPRLRWWNWATALTALLLVLVVLADWGLGLGRPIRLAAAPPSEMTAPAPEQKALAVASPEANVAQAEAREVPAAGEGAKPLGPSAAGEAADHGATFPTLTPTVASTATPSPAPLAPHPGLLPWRVLESALLMLLLGLLGVRWMWRRG